MVFELGSVKTLALDKPTYKISNLSYSPFNGEVKYWFSYPFELWGSMLFAMGWRGGINPIFLELPIFIKSWPSSSPGNLLKVWLIGWVVGWLVVVCKPVLVFSFGLDQAEQFPSFDLVCLLG